MKGKASTAGAGIPTHPAASLFPLLDGEDYRQLKTDIEKNGLFEPIWLLDGKILDGRNRFRACEELGIKPQFRPYEGDSPIEFVWSINGVRRHLSKSQRAAIAVEMLPHLQAEAKARQCEHGGTAPNTHAETNISVGPATKVAGKQVGVGRTLVERARKIRDADPKLFEKVKAGAVQVEPAIRQIKTGKPAPKKPRGLPPEQRAKQIRDLAKRGNRANQIAAELGIGIERVRGLARDHDIALAADMQLGKTRRIKARRVIEQTVNGLAGYAIGLQTINGGIEKIDPNDAAQWVSSLSESLPPLQKLKRTLQEIADGN